MNLLNYAPGFHFIAPHSLVRGGAELWEGLTSRAGLNCYLGVPLQMPHENFHLSEVPTGGVLPTSPPPEPRLLPRRFVLTKMKSTPVDFADDDEDGPNGAGGSDQRQEDAMSPRKQARL